MIYILSLGLLGYGISRILIGYAFDQTANWIRGMLIVVGILTIVLSILVLVFSGLTLLTLVIIIAVELIISGAEMVVSGVVGKTWLGKMVDEMLK